MGRIRGGSLLLLNALVLAAAASGAGAVTITVNTTSDANDPNDGGCSLREAIVAANTNAAYHECGPGQPSPAVDTIAFAIPGGGVHTIALGSDLPDVNDPIFLDGLTQPGASCPADWTQRTLLIQLLGGTLRTLSVHADGSTVRGLAAGNFELILTGSNERVQCNFLGSDPSGTALGGIGAEVLLSGAQDSFVGTDGDGVNDAAEGNLIVVTLGASAVRLESGAGGNRISGNRIGPGVTGQTSLRPLSLGSGFGVTEDLGTCPSHVNVIGTDGDGVSDALEGNVVAGWGNVAIQIRDGGTPSPTCPGPRIAGNRVGTNAEGTAAIPNRIGIRILEDRTRFTSVVIGTDGDGSPGDALEGNLISGSVQIGVSAILGFNGTAMTVLRVSGNRIGTNADGTAALPNGSGLVAISPWPGLVIGTDADGTSDALEGNLISGNGGDGIDLDAMTGARIAGNRIGTDAAGTAALPNGGAGIVLGSIDAASGTRVGGTTAAEGNVVAFNGSGGVWVVSGTGNSIRGNSIHSNQALGIDLDPNGVTENDPSDADTGANELQNDPVLTSAAVHGGSVSITGTLNSMPSTGYTVEYYASAVCNGDPNGVPDANAPYGEGQTLLGTKAVTTDGSGNASVDQTLAAAVAAGSAITSTATDPNGNTSEFSNCVQVLLSTPTSTSTPTATGTATATGTSTPTGTATATGIAAATGTATATGIAAATGTATSSSTPSPTRTSGPSLTATPRPVPSAAGIEAALPALLLLLAVTLLARRSARRGT